MICSQYARSFVLSSRTPTTKGSFIMTARPNTTSQTNRLGQAVWSDSFNAEASLYSFRFVFSRNEYFRLYHRSECRASCKDCVAPYKGTEQRSGIIFSPSSILRPRSIFCYQLSATKSPKRSGVGSATSFEPSPLFVSVRFILERIGSSDASNNHAVKRL